jgi:hypothetical protein
MGILEYILLGVTFGFLFEHFGKRLDLSFNFWERVALWVFWPVVLLITLYYFFKELFTKD